jgi:hypothetical protein
MTDGSPISPLPSDERSLSTARQRAEAFNKLYADSSRSSNTSKPLPDLLCKKTGNHWGEGSPEPSCIPPQLHPLPHLLLSAAVIAVVGAGWAFGQELDYPPVCQAQQAGPVTWLVEGRIVGKENFSKKDSVEYR